MAMRIEHDLLGEAEVPADALYGIHAARAMANFGLSGRPVHSGLIHAFGAVKLACARVNHGLRAWPPDVFAAIEQACDEMMRGELDKHISADALQGGAGTSTNMSVNEVLANRAQILLGGCPGEPRTVHPIEDLNRHQSTNDTYPTALRVAAIDGLRTLERSVVALQEAFQAKEKAFAGVVKVARTEMQDAALTTLGRTFGAFADALARDRWRVYKCEERLRVVNLGGTAIGSGLGAPRKFIFQATDALREITGFGLARAENLVDATQNTDAFVEVSGILKALASNLLKICGDLRILSSGPDAGLGEIRLPPRQAGSSIMPGKVNPVIPEAVIQAAIMAIAYDQALTTACSMGSLELNAFMPLVADCLLNSIDLLGNSCRILRTHCVEGIEADAGRCRAQAENATAAATALVETLGYEAAQRIALASREGGVPLSVAAVESGLITQEAFDLLIRPESVTRLGSQP
ncbi:MAG TPA: aspartate ammonia-lyase [Armatimonadota bacterium]|jgi:aspartate ammonia-lyase